MNYEIDYKEQFEEEKLRAIRKAKTLGYGNDILDRIEDAKSWHQVQNILDEARKNRK